MRTTFILLVFFLSIDARAQNSFLLEIRADASIDTKKLHFSCNNGETDIIAVDTFSNGSIIMKGIYYSKFVTVTMSYFENDSTVITRQFWITGNPAKIELIKNYKGDLFDKCRLSNVADIMRKNGALVKRLQEYTKNELKEMSELWDHANVYNPTTFNQVQKKRFVSLMNKSLKFIKRYNGEYFYYWYFVDQFYKGARIMFKNDTVLNYAIKDSIIKIFQPNITRSFEAKRIIKELDSYFYPPIDIAAPSFTTKTIDGELIDLKKFKGKYILLDFWATWCPPCMREIPFIKEIRNDIPEDKLVIIGVNKDMKIEKCKNAVLKHELNWLHIFDDQDKLYNLFGVSALPTTIVINDKGIIIYNSNVTQDKEKMLRLLKEF